MLSTTVFHTIRICNGCSISKALLCKQLDSAQDQVKHTAIYVCKNELYFIERQIKSFRYFKNYYKLSFSQFCTIANALLQNPTHSIQVSQLKNFEFESLHYHAASRMAISLERTLVLLEAQPLKAIVGSLTNKENIDISSQFFLANCHSFYLELIGSQENNNNEILSLAIKGTQYQVSINPQILRTLNDIIGKIIQKTLEDHTLEAQRQYNLNDISDLLPLDPLLPYDAIFSETKQDNVLT